MGSSPRTGSGPGHSPTRATGSSTSVCGTRPGSTRRMDPPSGCTVVGGSDEAGPCAGEEDHFARVMIPADQVGRASVRLTGIDDLTEMVTSAPVMAAHDDPISHFCIRCSPTFVRVPSSLNHCEGPRLEGGFQPSVCRNAQSPLLGHPVVRCSVLTDHSSAEEVCPYRLTESTFMQWAKGHNRRAGSFSCSTGRGACPALRGGVAGYRHRGASLPRR